MGKVKQKKAKNRHKPTGMMSVQEGEEQDVQQSSSSGLAEKTLPILEKLNCLEEREHACGGLANLVLEKDAVPVLMQHQIVRRVAPLILDNDANIQEAATGVLRNLTLSHSPNICEKMLEQDIMTPLIFYIKKFSESILVSSAESSEIVKQQSSVHMQVIHLLLNLSESASETIKKINDENIFPILTTFLNPEMFPLTNVLVTAQCLCTITEDNPTAAETLVNSDECLSVLEKNLLGSEDTEELVLLKVHMAGVFFNIAQSLPSHTIFEMFQAITRIFGKVLSCDISQYIRTVEEKLRASKDCQMGNGQQNGKVHNPTKSEDRDKEIVKLRLLLEAQQISLEILTNMCCTEDTDDQDWECVSSDEMSSEETCANCTGDAEMEPSMDSPVLSEEIVTSVLSNELPKKVLEKCSFLKLDKENGILNTGEGRRCLKQIETIQTRALVCLNNMLSAVDTDQLGGSVAITQLWDKIMEIAFQNSDSTSGFARTDKEFIEAASSALRSVLEKVAAEKIQCVTAEQVELLCGLCGGVKLRSMEAARVNFMNVLGIVGKMLIESSVPNALEQLQCIGTVLRDVVTYSKSLWVVAEALDAIFDVFADSPVADIAAGNIELLAHLEKVVPILKSRVKKERSTLGDRITIVNTARTNLVRFLKYKKQIS